MRECDVWRRSPETEFDNAMEGMEKLVMNRLYDLYASSLSISPTLLIYYTSTFTPQLLLTTPPRPVTTDDLERDRILLQRITLFRWVEEKHLDVPEGEGSKGFLMFAQQGWFWRLAQRAKPLNFATELLKLNHYKAPRDKVICILNSCKVIFGKGFILGSLVVSSFLV